jgi:hypothetical protein
VNPGIGWWTAQFTDQSAGAPGAFVHRLQHQQPDPPQLFRLLMPSFWTAHMIVRVIEGLLLGVAALTLVVVIFALGMHQL